MQVITKYLPQVVGLVMLVSFLAFSIGWVQGILAYGGSLQDRAVLQAQAMEYSKYAAYDNDTVTGGTVRSSARKFSRSIKFYIYVERNGAVRGYDVANNGTACPTPNPTTGLTSNTSTSSCSFKTKDMQLETSPAFIRLNDLYTSLLLRDSKGTITGIYYKLKT